MIYGGHGSLFCSICALILALIQDTLMARMNAINNRLSFTCARQNGILMY